MDNLLFFFTTSYHPLTLDGPRLAISVHLIMFYYGAHNLDLSKRGRGAGRCLPTTFSTLPFTNFTAARLKHLCRQSEGILLCILFMTKIFKKIKINTMKKWNNKFTEVYSIYGINFIRDEFNRKKVKV